MNDTQRILDILEANGTPLSRRDLLRLAGESGIALASLALIAGARPEPAAAQASSSIPTWSRPGTTTARGSRCSPP